MKSFLDNFYRHLANFFFSQWLRVKVCAYIYNRERVDESERERESADFVKGIFFPNLWTSQLTFASFKSPPDADAHIKKADDK